jgi:hypothetical protein
VAAVGAGRGGASAPKGRTETVALTTAHPSPNPPPPTAFTPGQELQLLLDYKLDESYTPQRVSVRAGTGCHDLKVRCARTPAWERGRVLHMTVKR